MKKITFLTLISFIFSVSAMKKTGQDLYVGGLNFFNDSFAWKKDENYEHELFLLKQSLKRFRQSRDAGFEPAMEDVAVVELMITRKEGFSSKEKKLQAIRKSIAKKDLEDAYDNLSDF